jgi:hypothetical protein
VAVGRKLYQKCILEQLNIVIILLKIAFSHLKLETNIIVIAIGIIKKINMFVVVLMKTVIVKLAQKIHIFLPISL